MRGGINPGDQRFHPRDAGVVDVWKDFRSGDGTLSSLDAVKSRRCPNSPRALAVWASL